MTAERPAPRSIFFFPDGTASVLDQRDRQMPRYQLGLHRHTIATLEADGIDWRRVPEIHGSLTMQDPDWWDAGREARVAAQLAEEGPQS